MQRRPHDRDALVELLAALKARDYAFVTPTPGTVGMNRRRPRSEITLRDIFGWSLPFREGDLEPELLAILRRASAVEAHGDGYRSLLRASTVRGQLFLHSAHPTNRPDSVFLGPDTYRFADLLHRALDPAAGVRTIFDIGAGAGVGGVGAGRIYPAARVWLGDVNAKALTLAAANAAHAGVSAETVLGPGLDAAPAALDLIVANPPYVAGESGRTYKDGGGDLGYDLSVDWSVAAAERLSETGRLVMYTASPIQRGGVDPLRQALEARLPRGVRLDYAEIDPDIFSSELGAEAYAATERLAAVSVILTRMPGGG